MRKVICPTCGNFEQELVLTSETVVEVLEMRDVEKRDVSGRAKTMREEVPIHYPLTRRDKQGPRHVVTQISCAQGHFITTEDRPE